METKRMCRRRVVFICAVFQLLSRVTCVPLADLLDRASQHSDQLHSLSTAVTQDLDPHVPPMGRMMLPRLASCHTASLATPIDKEQVLQVSEAGLLSLAQSLLQAWLEPLTLLSSSVRTLPHPVQSGLTRTLVDLQDQARSLGAGLEVLSDKLDSPPVVALPFKGAAGLGHDRLSKLANFYFLLSCFRRDSHKIDSFLKVLRCRAARKPPQAC